GRSGGEDQPGEHVQRLHARSGRDHRQGQDSRVRELRAMTAPIVQTPLGALQGTRHRDVLAFRGIRYAEPPVDEARFTAASPVAAWTGVYDATALRDRAIQAESFLPDLDGSGVTSEDCLFLNV